MALTTGVRQQLASALQRWWSKDWTPIPGSSDVVLAVVNATDDWIEDGQASYNQALPEPFRSAATLAQKTLVFCIVALARAGISFVRLIFGRLD
jgi:hypothetical protein